MGAYKLKMDKPRDKFDFFLDLDELEKGFW